MSVKYLFISSGSCDSYYIHSMIVGKSENIEKIKEEFKLKDKLFVELRDGWLNDRRNNKISDEEDMKAYCLWRSATDSYMNIIPKIAYKYDCTYVKIHDEFHFEGMDV